MAFKDIESVSIPIEYIEEDNMKELMEYICDRVGKEVDQKKLFSYLCERKIQAMDYLFKVINMNRIEKDFELTQIVRANIFKEVE